MVFNLFIFLSIAIGDMSTSHEPSKEKEKIKGRKGSPRVAVMVIIFLRP